MKYIKNKTHIILAVFSIALISLSFLIGTIVGKEQGIAKANTRANSLDELFEVWEMLDKKHPDAKDTKDDEKVWGAIKGLVVSLGDPYTTFFPPEETKEFSETISGEFSGVGMEVGEKDNILTVISPIKNTPAYNAGILAGDIIVKIDDLETINLSVDEAISHIRGEKGTQVLLTIKRGKERSFREISITRDTIQIPTIETELTEDNIFVIRLFSFSLHSPELFRDALKEFSEAKTNKLIIDLRNNPGGYLEAAIDIASWFLPKGESIVIEDFGENEKQKIHRSKGYDIFTGDLKLVILTNEGSASASEILAGALKEHGVAKIVGKKTFGKGSVQELIPLDNGTSLKVTIAEWLTPNGLSISKQGLTPDHEISITEEGVDSQFIFAKELINK